MLVLRDGRCVCSVPRRRLAVRAGEVEKGVTVRDQALERLARRIAEALPGAYGVLNVQIFVDPVAGEPRVIEINARYGGGFPLAFQAGARFPAWTIEEILGLPTTSHQRLAGRRRDAALRRRRVRPRPTRSGRSA